MGTPVPQTLRWPGRQGCAMGESAGHGQEVQEAAEVQDGPEGALEGANIASDSQATVKQIHLWRFASVTADPPPAARRFEDCPCLVRQSHRAARASWVRSGLSSASWRTGQGSFSGRAAGAFLKESLRAGIIDSGEGRDGRVKRKAAAVADERLKVQIAMERGVRERAPKARLATCGRSDASARCICLKAQARPQPQDEQARLPAPWRPSSWSTLVGSVQLRRCRRNPPRRRKARARVAKAAKEREEEEEEAEEALGMARANGAPLRVCSEVKSLGRERNGPADLGRVPQLPMPWRVNSGNYESKARNHRWWPPTKMFRRQRRRRYHPRIPRQACAHCVLARSVWHLGLLRTVQQV